MPVKRFPTDVRAEQIRALSPPPPSGDVAEILREVRGRGDAAVIDYERRFGNAAIAEISPVSRSFLEQARDALDPPLRAALELAIANVRTVATEQLANDLTVTLPQGQSVTYRNLPVGSAAAYVPGGRGSYPSTAVMCLATARVAGVSRVCAVSPVREHGQVDAAVAAVCALLGVDELYAIGGAQAIGALAYGTESIPAVDVIVGPGNAYVQEAKRQVAGGVGIDGIAGPSELVVVAGVQCDTRAIALDLLAQAEHGPDSLVVLISPEPDVLDAVIAEVGEIGAEMAVVLAADLDSAIELADAIAPEHMQICVPDAAATELAGRVRNAGCLFVGGNGATAFGDYVAGSNHVLPTGGAARFTSALSPATFTRRMACVTIPDSAVDALANAGAAIADAEGFRMHARSMEARKQ